jgi:hypothetical protein
MRFGQVGPREPARWPVRRTDWAVKENAFLNVEISMGSHLRRGTGRMVLSGQPSRSVRLADGALSIVRLFHILRIGASLRSQ